MSNKPTVSFGFKKKIETKVDESKIIQETSHDTNQEFLNHTNEETFNKNPSAKKALVIPLIRKNRYNLQSTKEESASESNKESVELEDKAVKEILQESKVFLDNKAPNDPDKEFDDLAVPLLLKNKLPEGFETDDKLNVAPRPDAASLDDYEEVPVEAFGMAMLRGMGWDPKVGIGKTFKEDFKMVETTVRPKGLGLGASAPNPNKNASKISKSDSGDSDVLEIKQDSFVLVQSGNHKRKYGIVQGIDADNAQCFIKFALGGNTATIGQYCLKPVSKAEYKQYSKDLSRLSKACEEGEKKKKYTNEPVQNDGNELQQSEKSSHRSHKHSSKHKRKYYDDDTSDGKNDSVGKVHAQEKYSTAEKEKHTAKHHYKDRKRDRTDNHEKRTKVRKGSPESRKDSGFVNKTLKTKKSRKTWLRPNLRVRMVDSEYRKGKFYREKLLVVDLLDDKGRCCCKTDKNELLDDIHEDMLETVVPRSTSDAYVLITSKEKSKHQGKLAKILEKDKDSCEAYLQLIEDRDVALRVSFDDICEYVGDAEADHMF